jgi:hypothetical protein
MANRKKSGRPNEERKATELLVKVLKQKAAAAETREELTQPPGTVATEAKE